MKRRVAKKRLARARQRARWLYVHCCGCNQCDDVVRAEVVDRYRRQHLGLPPTLEVAPDDVAEQNTEER